MDATQSANEVEESGLEPVSSIDADALVDLIGRTIALTDPLEVKRAILLRGLSNLLGADAWAVVSSREGGGESGGRIPEDYRMEIRSSFPEEEAFPSLSGHSTRHLLWSMKPLMNGTTGYICLVRQGDQAPFSARETRLFKILVEEVPWLYGAIAEAHPVNPIPEMPPRRRIIFDLLRMGLDRKQIADRLGISVNTVSDHQKILYRDLGIRTQVTLMQQYRFSTPQPNEKKIPE